MGDLILLVHTGSTLSMCGLIWFVQIVHYPLFASVGRDEFARYESEHGRRTLWVVGPLMIAEGITASWLLAFPPLGYDRAIPLTGFVLLLLIWVSTAVLQVPAHMRLAHGFFPDQHRRLTRTNWIRTILWSCRALIALWMVRSGA
ncbi:MAG: hypothetical protein ACKVU1_01750 [bacterium]